VAVQWSYKAPGQKVVDLRTAGLLPGRVPSPYDKPGGLKAVPQGGSPAVLSVVPPGASPGVLSGFHSRDSPGDSLYSLPQPSVPRRRNCRSCGYSLPGIGHTPPGEMNCRAPAVRCPGRAAGPRSRGRHGKVMSHPPELKGLNRT